MALKNINPTTTQAKINTTTPTIDKNLASSTTNIIEDPTIKPTMQNDNVNGNPGGKSDNFYHLIFIHIYNLAFCSCLIAIIIILAIYGLRGTHLPPPRSYWKKYTKPTIKKRTTLAKMPETMKANALTQTSLPEYEDSEAATSDISVQKPTKKLSQNTTKRKSLFFRPLPPSPKHEIREMT
jgi:hypothetical protein